LKNTLENICVQTYENLEIIICDNCSPGDETRKVVDLFTASDKRIVYMRHDANIGPFNNFKSGLERAEGDYFMWAADDDMWKNDFIESCLNVHLSDPNRYASVMTESQYFWRDKFFPFFAEGRPFYYNYCQNWIAQNQHVLEHAYGNLFYGLFKRKALLLGNKSIFSVIRQRSLNEIPLLLFASKHGEFRVLDTVKFFKQAPYRVYVQAKWEIEGGKLPNHTITKQLLSMPGTIKYHYLTMLDILKTISILDLDVTASKELKKQLFYKLMTHLCHLVSGRKQSRL